MNAAIRYRRNFSKANTSVRCFKTNGVTTDVDVFLHGNHIASLDTATKYGNLSKRLGLVPIR